MRRRDPGGLMQWGGVGILGVVGVLAVVLLWNAGGFTFANPRTAVSGTAEAVRSAQVSPSPSPTATSTPAPQPGSPTVPIPEATAVYPELPEITPRPGGQVYSVMPAPGAVGWVRENDDRANHFGDYNLYAGVYDGQRHLGAIQFDISEVPAGAPLADAYLALIGLSGEWLAQEGQWRVQVLEPWLDADWQNRTFADLAPDQGVAAELDPTLAASHLAADRANIVAFGPEALKELEARTFSGLVSFRIVGPASGADNLFSWDSGYGSQSHGWKPVLRIAAGPAPDVPPVPPTPEYVIITSTPTPENIVTEAAIAATAAVISATTGTATPLPLNWVTPIVVVPTATPANAATAQWHAAMATAEALLYGSATPQPPNVWTATPTPTGFAVVVTNTPTPANWSTAVADAVAEATRFATAGPPTPFPPFVITATPRPDTSYAVVTSTPAPLNRATARAQSAQATIVALTTGTYTPVPSGWVTPTPTPPVPLLIPLSTLTPTPTPRFPTPTPSAMPALLKGKIAFLSDRFCKPPDVVCDLEGKQCTLMDRPCQPALLAMDPDGSSLVLVTDPWIHEAARARESISPDGNYQVFVNEDKGVPHIFLRSLKDGSTHQLTLGAKLSYDPVWSPVENVLAFVSQLTGNNDEVFRMDGDGRQMRQLTVNSWEWDKHPTWSPDGTQIAFYSNRHTGRLQIWVMDAGGDNARNISNNEYNDWDPVWLK